MNELIELTYRKMVEKHGIENVTLSNGEIFVIDEEGESHRIWVEK